MIISILMGVLLGHTCALSIEPARIAPLAINDTFRVSINIDDAAQLVGYGISVAYDSEVLEVVEVSQGPFLRSFGSPVIWYGPMSTGPGLVYYVEECIMGTWRSARGSGTLFTVKFRVIGSGNSIIRFYTYDAVDLAGPWALRVPYFCLLDSWYGSQSAGNRGNFAISTGGDLQELPSAAWIPDTSKYAVIWQDKRNGNYDIYGQRVDSDETLFGASYVICDSTGDQLEPAIAYNPVPVMMDYKCALAIWTDYRRGPDSADIYGRLLLYGVPSSSELKIACYAGFQNNPKVACCGSRYLVTWQDISLWDTSSVFAKLLARSGGAISDSFRISESMPADDHYGRLCPSIAAGDSAFLVVWSRHDVIQGLSYQCLRARIIDTLGSMGPVITIMNDQTNQNYYSWQLSSCAFDGTKYLVIWSTWHRSVGNPAAPDTILKKINGQFVSRGGVKIGSNFLIYYSASDSLVQVPQVCFDGANYLVTWDEKKGDGTDVIRGRFVSPSGNMSEVFDFCSEPYQQTFPALAKGSSVLLAWQDYRNGTDYNIWGEIIGDMIPPKPTYIPTVEKSGNDVVLYWNQVTTDVLGGIENVDHYVVYRSTTPDFVPGISDSIGYVAYPNTTFTDVGALGSSNSYYYLIKTVDVAANRSCKSNMGFAFRKFFNENTGTTSDRNWVSLPWHSEYSTVQNLANDLSPAGNPLTLITNLRNDQAYESWLYDELFGWYGTDFAIASGNAYEMVANRDTVLMIVGSNDPDGLVTLNENAGSMSDRNWISIPYNAVYSTVSDITVEYSPLGNPLTLLTNMRDDQAYESWLYDELFGWYGADFAIEPGRGYEFVTIVDTMWNPTEYSNEVLRALVAKKQCLRIDIEQHVGQEIGAERMPVWTVRSPALISSGEATIDYSDVRNYTLATDASKNISVHSEPGVSHIVFIEFEIEDCEDILFTAYRPEHVQDVLTEDVIGCGYVCRDSKIGIWFNTGNFRIPWKDAEEVIVIIEAFTTGGVLWNAVTVNLDKGVDMQRLGTIELHPMPVLKIGDNGVCWVDLNHNLVVGYSVYEGAQRMNDEVLTETRYSGSDETVIKPVIRGGFETVHGIQDFDNKLIPVSYTFLIYPNPVVAEAHIQYALPVATEVCIKIYDVAGKLTATLVSELQNPGYYDILWSSVDDRGRRCSSGIYFLQMRTDDYQQQKKIVLVK